MATQAELGKHLDLSDRSVRELLAKGVLPTARRGDHDLDACRTAYIRHLRAAAAGRTLGQAGDDLTAERARLAREQADHYALGNAAKRRELLPRGEITRAVAAAFSHVRDRLMALPTRIAGPLAYITDPAEVRRRLDIEIGTALAELAEARIIPLTEDHENAA